MRQPLLIFFILLTISSVSGQVLKSVGIKAGISESSQSWHYKTNDNTIKKDSRTGFYGAATLEFLKLKYFGITADMGYCVKGNTEKIPNTTAVMPEGDGTFTTYDTKFEYLTLSPMLKAKYETHRFVPYALLGLRLDYQISYKSDFSYEHIDKDFQKMIWGANFGVGVEYKIQSFGIFLEGQYQYDFSKVLDTPENINNSGIEIKNKALIICIGLKYYLIKNNDGNK